MTKAYKHKLTKKELKHLKGFGILGMTAIKKQMETLAAERYTTPHEPCYECKSIARKLGLPV